MVDLNKIRIGVVIVNYNSGHYLSQCLKSLSMSTAPLEIVVVDNNSSDHSVLDSQGIIGAPNILKLIGRLLLDPRVPRRAKITLGVAAAYVVSPIDLVPDVIPVIGWADDVLLVLFAIDSLIERAGPEIVDEHWDGPGDLLSLVREAVGLSRSIMPKRLTAIIDRLSG